MLKAIKRLLDEACGHLHAAKIQMVPGDDQIICDHVRDASALVEAARSEVREMLKGERNESQQLEKLPAQSALETLLADPERLKDYPIETVERMFALQKDFEDRRARADFNQAFLAVQGELQPVANKGWNPHTKSHYARAEEVFAMLNPILVKHGLSRSFSVTDSPIPEHFAGS